MLRKIGIIGFGNMGFAISEGIKRKRQVYVYDKDKEKTENTAGVVVSRNIVDLVNEVNAVILAVKPQDFAALLGEIKSYYIKNKLIISIAAGITTAYIEKYLGQVSVIRVMPNMPARIGKGMTCLSKGKFATPEDLDFTEEIFRHLGATLVLNEDMMDAATVISGSGPGYFYDLIEGKNRDEIKEFAENEFIPALEASAEKVGFSPQQSLVLAEVTSVGSIAFLEQSGIPPAELKKQVVSKGGTTEAALEVLHRGGSLDEAVMAALARARELSKT
jgi:pyrroline-5-carboxylate reductase